MSYAEKTWMESFSAHFIFNTVFREASINYGSSTLCHWNMWHRWLSGSYGENSALSSCHRWLRGKLLPQKMSPSLWTKTQGSIYTTVFQRFYRLDTRLLGKEQDRSTCFGGSPQSRPLTIHLQHKHWLGSANRNWWCTATWIKIVVSNNDNRACMCLGLFVLHLVS